MVSIKREDVKKNVEMLYNTLENQNFNTGAMIMMVAELLAYYDGVLNQLGTEFSRFFSGRQGIIDKYTNKGGPHEKEKPRPKDKAQR